MKKSQLLDNLLILPREEYTFLYNGRYETDYISLVANKTYYTEDKIDLIEELLEFVRKYDQEEVTLDGILEHLQDCELPSVAGMIYYEDVFGFFKKYHAEVSCELQEQGMDEWKGKNNYHLNDFVSFAVSFFLNSAARRALSEAFCLEEEEEQKGN